MAMNTRSGARKPRTKTFTGCWTCRSRHIKCDLGRPFCNRCAKANTTCGGYGVRLSWTQNKTLYTPNKRQQPRQQLRQNSPGLVASDLHSLEQPAQEHDENPNPLTTQAGSPQAESSTPSSPGHGLLSGSSTDTPEQGCREGFEFAMVPRALLQPPPGLNEKRLDHSVALVLNVETTDLNFQDVSRLSTESASTGASQAPVGLGDFAAELLASPQPARQPDTLADIPLQIQLLEHWTTYLLDALMPIPSWDNPMRTIITPIALDGAQAKTDLPSPSTAVFHLICSASAFHLAQVQGSSRMTDVCLSHHDLGIKHLRETVSVKDERLFVPLLAAFCMCIINETLSVGTPFWRVHIRGACTWINQIDSSVWTATTSASTLYQLFFGLVTMTRLQLVSEPDAVTYRPHLKFFVGKDQYHMDKMLGISWPTLKIWLEMIDLRHANADLMAISPGLLDSLEMRMYLSSPPHIECAVESEIQLIVTHHSYMYYYATLIYFRRSFRSGALASVQPWVSKALEHLEIMLRSTTKPFSPSVWPVAMMAFEAQEPQLHQRIGRVLDQLSTNLQFDIWSKLKNFTVALWNERLKGNETLPGNLSWEAYCHQHDLNLLLL